MKQTTRALALGALVALVTPTIARADGHDAPMNAMQRAVTRDLQQLADDTTPVGSLAGRNIKAALAEATLYRVEVPAELRRKLDAKLTSIEELGRQRAVAAAEAAPKERWQKMIKVASHSPGGPSTGISWLQEQKDWPELAAKFGVPPELAKQIAHGPQSPGAPSVDHQANQRPAPGNNGQRPIQNTAVAAVRSPGGGR